MSRDVPIDRSLWSDTAGERAPRPALEGDQTADVVIVGAGYSGLWTAYYLLARSPGLRVVVVEREHVGFGASGRNGGWAIGELASHDVTPTMTRALFEAVAEIGRVVSSEQIECDYAAGGTIRVARTAPQLTRQRTEVAEMHARGFTERDLRLLSADEARRELAAEGVLGGLFFAHAAALHPLKLVRGVAAAVERRGATIFEDTPVTAVEPGEVVTPHGVVRADVVVLATEAYTRDLPGRRRTFVPLYSQMIATEPLPESTWDEIGLAGRATFADDRHVVIYGQRTADDRIAFGARGNPAYLFGSRISRRTESSAHEAIAEVLRELLPQVAEAQITHRWGGVLAVPRDWKPTVAFDAVTRFGSLGGFVGEGVAATNLAGATMADLVLGRATEGTALAWVNHRSRRWEPEPLRWAAINAAFAALARADRIERETGNESRLAKAVLKLIGR